MMKMSVTLRAYQDLRHEYCAMKNNKTCREAKNLPASLFQAADRFSNANHYVAIIIFFLYD